MMRVFLVLLILAQGEFGTVKQNLANAIDKDPEKLVDVLITRVKEYTDQPVTGDLLTAIATDMGVDVTLKDNPDAEKIKSLIDHCTTLGMSVESITALKQYAIDNVIWDVQE
jgi:hypothetical protein